MSEFWNASDPPGVKEWCEKEVETACREMLSNVKVMGWLRSGRITADPYVGGDWDLEVEGGGPDLPDLLKEALEDHVCIRPSRHFAAQDRPSVLAALDGLQRVIDAYRALCCEPHAAAPLDT